MWISQISTGQAAAGANPGEIISYSVLKKKSTITPWLSQETLKHHMMKLLGLKLTRQEVVRDQIFQKSFFFSPQEALFGNNKYIYEVYGFSFPKWTKFDN